MRQPPLVATGCKIHASGSRRFPLTRGSFTSLHGTIAIQRREFYNLIVAKSHGQDSNLHH